MRRKVEILKQSNFTNTTTQFETLNTTLGFLEQLFKTSGCLIKLCDTLVDGPVLRKKRKKESVILASIENTLQPLFFLQDAHHDSPKRGIALPKNGQDINEDVIRTLVALTGIG